MRDKQQLPELNRQLEEAAPSELAKELQVGEFTLRDIVEALGRPERDPRNDLPKPIFKKGILKLEDLTPGMELKGTVLNVVDFGAFVDIGLKDSGLVHISQLANRYIKTPHDVVSVGDVVTVWVMSVDHERKRVSLTMVKPGTERQRAAAQGGRRRGQGGGERTAGRTARPGSGAARSGAASASQRVGTDVAPGRRGSHRRTGRTTTGAPSRSRSRWGDPARRGTLVPRRDYRPRSWTCRRSSRAGEPAARWFPRPPRIGSWRTGGGPFPGPGSARPGPGPGRQERPQGQRGSSRPSRPSPPPPPLSKEALSGSVPLRTFGQLKQLWEARVDPTPEELAAEAAAAAEAQTGRSQGEPSETATPPRKLPIQNRATQNPRRPRNPIRGQRKHSKPRDHRSIRHQSRVRRTRFVGNQAATGSPA